MNRYQLLFLACLYAGIAYGAYRERKANTRRFEAEHYWQTGFLFSNIGLSTVLFISIFTLIGTL